MSRTNAVLLDRKPFLREILTADCLGVTSICRHQYAVARRYRVIFERREYALWPALGPTMRPVTLLALRIDTLETCVRTRLLFDFLGHGGGRVVVEQEVSWCW